MAASRCYRHRQLHHYHDGGHHRRVLQGEVGAEAGHERAAKDADAVAEAESERVEEVEGGPLRRLKLCRLRRRSGRAMGQRKRLPANATSVYPSAAK